MTQPLRVHALVLFGLLIVAAGPSFAAGADESGREPDHPWGMLGDDNLLARFATHDFSSLLVPRSPFLGYIGENYRRLWIDFNNVHRDGSNPNVYHVTGSSWVHEASGTSEPCYFRGTITVRQVKEYMNLHYGADDFYKPRQPRAQGVLVGRYHFVEEGGKSCGGVFDGMVSTNWMLDRYGVMLYDDVEMESSDSYRNNQYAGTWTSNATGRAKVANWGEYRIPSSGDLDIGAGEFGANPKYRSVGWDGPDVTGH